MSQEALKKLVKIASNQQKELKKLAQLIDWEALKREYSNHLFEARSDLSDAAELLTRLRGKAPLAAHEAINMRVQRLYHYMNEITELQDDIEYGIKPAIEAKRYDDE